MKILFAASETVPFIKTGGLGDVVGSLGQALARSGHDVRIVFPFYQSVKDPRGLLKGPTFPVRVPSSVGDQWAVVHEAKLSSRLRYYALNVPHLFDRPGVYADETGHDFPDNDSRFIFLSRAALEIARTLRWAPDIVHAHDWQTGLLPVYLSTLYKNDPLFKKTGSVFSIHNLAYQGVFPKETLLTAGFSWTEFTKEKLEYYDRVNFLKGGISYAKQVNTVSPTYAAEIKTEAFGQGLDGLLRLRENAFRGILNGLDTETWNPAKDPFLAKTYTAGSLKKRSVCRKDLQQTVGLALDETAPLLGMVSRLDAQKGFDVLLDIMDAFVEQGCQAVFLGSGHRVYQSALATLARKHPGRVSASSEFNETLAHKIYGGSDIFLMPSRFEPCGLGQMIALRYGAVPVVTPTGGLKDTVTPMGPHADGVGFVADRVDTPAYRDALWRAVHFFKGFPKQWRALQKRGMAQNFEWYASAQRYESLYKMSIFPHEKGEK